MDGHTQPLGNNNASHTINNVVANSNPFLDKDNLNTDNFCNSSDGVQPDTSPNNISDFSESKVPSEISSLSGSEYSFNQETSKEQTSPLGEIISSDPAENPANNVVEFPSTTSMSHQGNELESDSVIDTDDKNTPASRVEKMINITKIFTRGGNFVHKTANGTNNSINNDIKTPDGYYRLVREEAVKYQEKKRSA